MLIRDKRFHPNFTIAVILIRRTACTHGLDPIDDLKLQHLDDEKLSSQKKKQNNRICILIIVQLEKMLNALPALLASLMFTINFMMCRRV